MKIATNIFVAAVLDVSTNTRRYLDILIVHKMDNSWTI
jgi:hypothetical protein